MEGRRPGFIDRHTELSLAAFLAAIVLAAFLLVQTLLPGHPWDECRVAETPDCQIGNAPGGP